MAHQLRYVAVGYPAFVNDVDRNDRQAVEHARAGLGREEDVPFAIVQIVGEQQMRQVVVRRTVLGGHPFPIEHVALAERVAKIALEGLGPGLVLIELPLAAAAVQRVTARLQHHVALGGVERQPGIGAVGLLLPDEQQVAALQRRHRQTVVLIAVLQRRPGQMAGARIFQDRVHALSIPSRRACRNFSPRRRPRFRAATPRRRFRQSRRSAPFPGAKDLISHRAIDRV